MRAVRRGVAAACAVLAALLAGCASLLPGVGESSAGAMSRAASASPSPTATDLLSARKAAGIADCPTSSGRAAPTGGLPDVTLDCLGGDSRVRLAGLRGPMLITLWAQWCEPCLDEAPYISGFASIQQRVAVLGINYSDPQPALAIQALQLVGATYPQLVDRENTLKGPLGVSGIPYTLLIDADGKVVARHPGQFISLENVQQWVEKGLDG